MSRELNITDAERQLLGSELADELARDERWLAGEPMAPPMPPELPGRVMAAIRAELSPVRRSRWQALRTAAAVLVFAVLVGLFARYIGPDRPPAERTGPIGRTKVEAVAAAEQAINEFLAPIDQAEVRLHFAMKELELPSANPWQALASVIEER